MATKATTPTPVEQVETILDDAAANPVIVGAITSATGSIKPATRKVFYYIGVGLGIVVAVAATVQAAVTGNIADAAGTVGGLALSVNSLLAAAHLNVAA